MPLLSLVITTKNRFETACRSIAAALALMPADVELIVQDCSDTRVLEEHLARHHGGDPRLRYEHRQGKISLADNWNFAIARATGDFVSIIGDDDAFLPALADIVAWTAKHGYLAASFRHTTYFWPGYPGRTRGNLFYRPMSGETTIRDTADELRRSFSRKGMAIEKVPQLYHGTIAREILVRHHRRHGYYVRSTSPDYYSAYAMSSQIREHPDIDYPGAICGFSQHSNGARTIQKKLGDHVTEYGHLDWPSQLPVIPANVHLIVAEAAIKALTDAGKPELLAALYLPRYYAAAIFDRPRDVVALVAQLRRQPGQGDHLVRTLGQSLLTEGRYRFSFRLLAQLPPAALALRGFKVAAADDVFAAAERQLELLASQPLTVGPAGTRTMAS